MLGAQTLCNNNFTRARLRTYAWGRVLAAALLTAARLETT